MADAEQFAIRVFARLEADATRRVVSVELAPLSRNEIVRLTEADIKRLAKREFKAWVAMVFAHLDEYEAIAETLRQANIFDRHSVVTGRAAELLVEHHVKAAMVERDLKLAMWEGIRACDNDLLMRLLQTDEGKAAWHYWRAFHAIAANSEHPAGRFYWNRVMRTLTLWRAWKYGHGDLRFVP